MVTGLSGGGITAFFSKSAVFEGWPGWSPPPCV
jgi:hypothetical protein